MNKKYSRTPVRAMAVVAGGSVIAAMSAFPAAAAGEGDVEVVNTETVKIYTDATGKVDSKRIYEQLALTGQGTVDLTNPVIADGLRNLDGFGGFDVEGGDQLVKMDVDGEENVRTVSDYDGDLPLDISTTFVLDGEEVEPEDVVGESGELTVTYTVKNITQEQQLVSFPDGKGGTMSREVEVMMPMVGSLTTTLPNSFRNPRSEANMAGDGEGGTKLSFTMTLLAPIGSDTAELSYTADVVDAVVPDASITALPVNPLDVPSFKSAGASYQNGAATGEELANGAATIDMNLLKLRDGASKLLAGMIQLRDGAGKLSKGLKDTAAPGSAQLADGAGELNAGLGELADGTGKLSAGSQELSAGTVKLADGSVQLADGSVRLADGTVQVAGGADKVADGADKVADGADKVADGAGQVADGAGQLADGSQTAYEGSQELTAGLGQISAGLDELAGTKGLPAALSGVGELQAGVDALLAGMGDVNTPGTILFGLNKLNNEVPVAAAGAAKLSAGLQDVKTNLTSAKGLVDSVIPAVGAAAGQGANLADVTTQLNQLINTDCGVEQACIDAANAALVKVQAVQTAVAGLTGATTKLGTNSAILGGVLGAFNAPYPDGILAGASALAGGLAEAEAGVALLYAGAGEVNGGLMLVDGGLASLAAGLAKAVDGVMLLNTGAGDAYAGGNELTSGLGQISSGAGDLAGGAGELAGGAGDLASGAGDLAGGAGDLSDGADQVADGAGDLSAGAGELSDGAGKVSAGAGELSAGALLLDDGANKAYEGSGLIADGAQKLADGLVEAGDGSGLLFDGLVQAALGVPKLRDGAQELSDKGTSKLVDAGLSTAQEYGLMYAVLEAGGERADKSKMMVGAPEEAIGLAAYSYEIKGEDGEGGRNVTRGLAGLALLGAGAAAFGIRRRLV